jgi:hypothetical protein
LAQADRARFESLGLRALVGFGLAVRATAARTAAREHWSVAARRGVLRGWLEAAREQKVKARQLTAAVYTYTRKLEIKGLASWIAHAARKRRERHLTAAALAMRATGAARRALRAWRGAAAYLAPLRRDVEALTAKVGDYTD